jgi:hypothetical protein
MARVQIFGDAQALRKHAIATNKQLVKGMVMSFAEWR